MIIVLFVLVAILYIALTYVCIKLDKAIRLIFNIIDFIIKASDNPLDMTEEKINKFIESLY